MLLKIIGILLANSILLFFIIIIILKFKLLNMNYNYNYIRESLKQRGGRVLNHSNSEAYVVVNSSSVCCTS